MSELDLAFRLARPGFTLDVVFRVPGLGITGLFGPSGCGKTSILRCVAGLERAAGHCRLDGETWQDDARGRFIETHCRPIGYVFQEASLFSHLSVRRNLEYGMTRIPADCRRVGMDEVVNLLGIRRHLARDPSGLSGGERQRVAIARALLTSPRLLLMDEPLAAVDHAGKQEILPYLERLHEHLRIPVLYVTHSPDEIARLADHIVMLEGGRVQAMGNAGEVLARLDLPLAHAPEASAIIDGEVSRHDERYQLTWIKIPGGRLAIARSGHAPGSRVRVQIHARDVSLALDEPGNSSILNVLPARIQEIRDLNPAQVLVKLTTTGAPGAALLARITRHSLDHLALHQGQNVYAQVKAVALTS